MRSDLDRLMKERGLAGMVVFGHDRYSSAMYYATGQRLHVAIYFRAADGRAHLIHDPMERDQAAQVPGDRSTFTQHRLRALMESEGHPARAYGKLIGDMTASLGMDGPIAFFGESELGYSHMVLERAFAVNPALSVDASYPDILTIARATKDDEEIAAIRHAARGAVVAIERLREYLGELKRDGDGFRHNGSGPVTLGTLRRLIHGVFVEHGLAEDGESIVSQGRDAGVPHNRGNDAERLRAGAPILVDIFPGEAGGGYHSDLTRTFCVGEAPAPLRALYDDVRAAFDGAMGGLELGRPCRELQDLTCDVFEQRGHPTVRSHEGTEEGYVHGVGHGVGLSVHEAPRLGGPPSNLQTLDKGMVITVEPGLYYPSRDMGVRIEDLVLVRADGTFENLTPAPYELEVAPRA
jgi:Xaa-Pro aminopeptidase